MWHPAQTLFFGDHLKLPRKMCSWCVEPFFFFGGRKQSAEYRNIAVEQHFSEMGMENFQH